MSRRKQKLKKLAGSLLPPTRPPGSGVVKYLFRLVTVLDFGSPCDPAAHAAAQAAARDDHEKQHGVKLPADAKPSPVFADDAECEAYCMRQQADLIALGEDDIARATLPVADQARQPEAEERPAPRQFPPNFDARTWGFPTTQKA